ncbi:unnamed protein product [Lactuca virosa]|uniref:ribose-5-phosphate isomerase n=1 Tax=Lactuca virosa TaxID=75947 RepID=A0AAU9LGE3_9ASTR|nr:unnamed protein product [Lactuca virosa]
MSLAPPDPPPLTPPRSQPSAIVAVFRPFLSASAAVLQLSQTMHLLMMKLSNKCYGKRIIQLIFHYLVKPYKTNIPLSFRRRSRSLSPPHRRFFRLVVFESGMALSLGIPLSDLDNHPVLDLAIDGADEVDPNMKLVKGCGGSLLREKMIKGCCKNFVVIVDESKLVDYVGGSGLAMPVEIVPFCWKFTAQKLQSLLILLPPPLLEP